MYILMGGPVAFRREEMGFPISERLIDYQNWWENEGFALSGNRSARNPPSKAV